MNKYPKVEFRATGQEIEKWTKIAEGAGKKLGAWFRDLGNAAVLREAPVLKKAVPAPVAKVEPRKEVVTPPAQVKADALARLPVIAKATVVKGGPLAGIKIASVAPYDPTVANFAKKGAK